MFFNRFYRKSNWSTKHFLFNLNLELHRDLKVRASEINFASFKASGSPSELRKNKLWQSYYSSIYHLASHILLYIESDF